MLKAFGFEKYNIYLSTQPEECIGDRSIWEESEKALQRALSTLAIPYQIDKGGGAFYGPKIDIKILDALERAWQCTTIQLDFNLPERFDITYVDSDGQRKRPVMIHRAIFGSLERFLGILTEHYKGAFPAWFSPCQVIIITISERHVDYGKEIKEMMLRHKIRVKSDFRNESLGYKIREARLKRYPYWIIIGDKEVSSRKISLRARESKKQELLSQEETLARIIKETRFPKFDNFN
jgi:threonyl-tRNA synthetase